MKLKKLTTLLNGKKLYSILLHITLLVFVTKVIFLSVQNRELKEKIYQRPESLKTGDYFSLENLEPLSQDYELDVTKRQLVLVFNTTCHFCKQNLYWWNRIIEKNTDKDISIVGISLHSFEKTKAYVGENGLDFPIVCARNSKKFLRENKLNGVPTTLLRDQDGQVERVWRGLLSETIIDEIAMTGSPGKYSMNSKSIN